MENNKIVFNMKSVNKRLKEIENGIYTFAEVWRIEEKEEIERILIEKLKEGTITDPAKKALLKYECELINNKKKNFNDMPDIIKDNIKNNENYMNYIKEKYKR